MDPAVAAFSDDANRGFDPFSGKTCCSRIKISDRRERLCSSEQLLDSESGRAAFALAETDRCCSRSAIGDAPMAAPSCEKSPKYL